MRRRDFIEGVLGSAAAWPLPALAQQQPGRVRLIGALTGIADDPLTKAEYAAFRQELQRLGWIEGQNVRIDVRFGEGDASRIRKQAAELVALSPDVILSTGGVSTELLLQATRTIPIVFVIVPDPVGSGFIESLAEPGGNATGFMQFEYSLSGAAQGNCAQCKACGSDLGSHNNCRHRAICRDPIGSAVSWN